jgi:hypothetical protein
MMIAVRASALLLAAVCSSCAVAGTADVDAAVSTVDDLGPSRGDGAPPRDGLIAPSDGAPATTDGPTTMPCTLGTPDHCGTCSTVCPPGADDDGTHRTCSLPTAFGACGIICKGEYYDVDGKADNGCEELDTPVQDTSVTAVVITLPATLEPPDGGFTTNPRNVQAKICGDARDHDAAPTQRPDGREDWYKLQVMGGGDPNSGVTACLGVSSFPADGQYEVCLAQNPPFIPGDCVNVAGGVQPAGGSNCKTLPKATDETGTYYARVRKLMGTNSSNRYALFLKH